MTIISASNIALEGLNIIISAILLACLYMGGYSKYELGRRFVWLLVCNLCVLFCSITGWIFDGNMHPHALILTKVATFCLFIFWYLLRAAASMYLITYIRQKTEVAQGWVVFTYAVTGLYVLLLFVGQCNGNDFFYYYDEQNRYFRSWGAWIPYSIECVMYPAGLWLILKNRKSLVKSDMRTLITYELVPMAVALIQGQFFGILPLNTASTISTLILYARVQLEQARRLKEQELELTESRIDIMLSQIQPHFLYNTLNTIESLVSKDPEKAEILVRDFAMYLRENMDSLKQKEPVPFERELKHLQTYIEIEKIRFKDRLTLRYDFETTDFEVPILTVQPLVENAVRYGVMRKRLGGTVTVATREDTNGVRIIISDDGVGFDPYIMQRDGRSHVGIDNVRERLQTQCGGSLMIDSIRGVGTIATIKIPRRRSS